jgi:protein involved in polysaccharide export with SLBB domain
MLYSTAMRTLNRDAVRRCVAPWVVRVALCVLGVPLSQAPAALRAQGDRQVRASDPGSETLRPGDSIKLSIWREPDLSGEFGVNERSEVVLPRVGPVNVEGITPDSLKQFLLSSYGQFLRNPSIEVTLRRRITILGAVRSPGVYPVDPTITVGEALALAGGADPDGKPDQVQLKRDGETTVFRLASGTRIADTPIRSGDQLYVPQKGWLSRNPGLFIGTLTGVAGLVVTLLTR